VKYGTMEVIKRKAVQQLWHYRPQTRNGDITIFIDTDHKKVPQLPADRFGAQQSQVCPTINEVDLHLNKVEET